MTPLLIIILYILPIAYALRTSFRGGRIEVNHVTLFSIGFVAYWVSPIALGVLFKDWLEGLIGTSWTDTFLSSGHFNEYLIIISIVYVAFASGDWLGQHTNVKPPPPHKALSLKVLSLLSGVGLIVAAGMAYRARDLLLQGHYALDTNSEQTRGGVASSCIVLFVLALMYIIQTRPKQVRQMLTSPLLMCFWPFGLVVLLSGTRLYFISFLLMLLVYWTVYVRAIRVRALVGLLATSILLAGVVGIARMGGGNLLSNILAEPIYTSFSLLSFLEQGGPQTLNFPTYLASDLINLVPSVVLPDKEQFIRAIPDIYSPQGALNSYVSFSSNFGVIGTVSFMFFFGFGMRRLRRRSGSWSLPAYVMISGWSAFALFRDPFSVSIIKDILEFSILLPAAICMASFWLTWSSRQAAVR